MTKKVFLIIGREFLDEYQGMFYFLITILASCSSDKIIKKKKMNLLAYLEMF